jgi:phage/conjugal plasmid C-4 type zinc finger TraR family protein
MSSGFTRDGAVQDQIDATIADAVARARGQAAGPGRADCKGCGELIPVQRRQLMPHAVRCVHCQAEHDAEFRATQHNRRAPMDSQLR